MPHGAEKPDEAPWKGRKLKNQLCGLQKPDKALNLDMEGSLEKWIPPGKQKAGD